VSIKSESQMSQQRVREETIHSRKDGRKQAAKDDGGRAPRAVGLMAKKATKSPGGCAPTPDTSAAGASLGGVEHHKP
jgi:hypothetical protein